MKVSLFVGSPRARSNSRSMAVFLQERLEERGATVAIADPVMGRASSVEFDASAVEAIREADAVVILAPVYLDLPPYVALQWLHELWSRREQLEGSAPSIYAVSHSGYFEPVHKRVSIEALHHFARRMNWPWRGALAFGGTSPIDGRPLEEAGPFSRRVRPALAQLSELIVADRPVPESLIRAARRRPIPLPRRLIVWIMNAMLRRR